MLFLQLPLLAALLPGSVNAEVIHEHTTFRLSQISYYANESWAQTLGSAWLDELQTHRWDSETGTVIFLHTWSKGNFSNEELTDLELLFRVYMIGISQEIHTYSTDLGLRYPVELQVRLGCELSSSESAKGFMQAALEGSDFLSFQNTTWVPSPEGGEQAQKVCDLLNLYEGIKQIVENLMSKTCPRFLLGILDAGKTYLQRQVRPEAWLSSSSILGSGRLMLVCHVSGFYPMSIWVMWMRGEQEQLDSKRDDVLPNADGTWYVRVILEVEAEDAVGLSCHVKHSSLGDQDLILNWGHSLSMNLIILAVVVPLILLIVLVLWFKRRWSYRGIP
ncbi:T-cell surface glycoprotein CD1c-like isoform X1 [Dipodomys spectabilis]|uniref:T-cell surface glycoprotein CD1c-like isoform X1 n=1 Tax=Dipodomys spectabilis TaxID=105255 RepID=UPI001C546EE6|nr:T-cell surface glycoprotein CD1c-like isoform X1 [Dipodomys spectabilis]